MRTLARATVVLLALLTAVRVDGQTTPNIERGFAADKMYQFGDIDHVNIFNGNVSLTIPIGGSLAVSDRLSVALTLTYNSKLWDSHSKSLAGAGGNPEDTAIRKFPNRRSNAGLGWLLSLGRLIEPDEFDVLNPQDSDWHYESPDGSDHVLSYGTLHNSNAETAESNVSYSRNNTYYRLRRPANLDTGHAFVDSPDGIIREFESYTVVHPPPDNASHRHWRLIKIKDPFGNYITVSYAALKWTITDQYGRATVVNFKDVGATDSEVTQWNYLTAVSSVVVPAPDDGITGADTATYEFSYDPANEWVYRGFCGLEPAYPTDSETVKVPLLKEITLPDQSIYAFTYTSPTPPADVCHAGQIASMTLPTMGVISWTYQSYILPSTSCDIGADTYSSGVYQRTFHDPYGAVSDATWTYTQAFSEEPQQDWRCAPHQTVENSTPPPEEMRVTVKAPSGDETVHYFSIWNLLAVLATPHDAGFTRFEYGLPLSHKEPDPANSSRAISRKWCRGTCSPATILRKEYVEYSRDYGTNIQFDTNRRLKGTRTVYFREDSQGGASVADHAAETTYSDFDGVGHYRVVSETGDFLGSGGARTVTTPYNTSAAGINTGVTGVIATGTYEPTSNGGTFQTPLTTAPWILNLYPSVTVAEGTDSAVQQFCFVPTTGFLSGARTLVGGSAGSTDLLVAYTSDPLFTGDAVGNVTREQFFGGDRQSLTTPGTLCELLAAPPAAVYDIRHAYARGIRKSSEYYSGGSSMGFKFLDITVDPNTGLTTASRDTSGVATDFVYDPSRRVTSAKTEGLVATTYAYTKATTSARASALLQQQSGTSAFGRAAYKVFFDFLGRVSREERLRSEKTAQGGDLWAARETKYDTSGRKERVSEWEETPTHFTTFSNFDPFGRAKTITAPDGELTTVIYTGVEKVERTVEVRTAVGIDELATTTELYDRFGRLHEITEPGSNSTTTYKYDVGNRLKHVSMAGTGVTQPQVREFVYDHRGFLQSEKHPELGLNGNGTSEYSEYDARGHAHRKITGAEHGPFDLWFTFDLAERLTGVEDLIPGTQTRRPLKEFTFATANEGTPPSKNYRQGKLETSVRHNYLPAVSGDFKVTETLKYEKLPGLVSHRETKVEHGTTLVQKFTQAYSYNDMAQPTGVTYPTCLTLSCSGAFPVVTLDNKFLNGRLTGITGYAPSIAYHANETVASVVHGTNGGVNVADTYTADSSGLPRPASIAFTGWEEACTPPSATITGSNSACATSTGNTASVNTTAGASYSWSISDGGTITSGADTPSIQYSAPQAAGTITLSVTVTAACGSTTTATNSVSITAAPTASVCCSATIPPNTPTDITATLTGTAPWTVSWSDSFTQTVSAPNTTATRTVSPTATTTYTITTLSDATCSVTPANASVTLTVGTPPPVPTGLIATTQSANHQVLVQWTVVGTPAAFQVERAPRVSGPWECVKVNGNCVESTTSSYVDTPPASSTPVAYVYRVKARSAENIWSNSSNIDYATTATALFTDDPLPANTLVIRGRHIAELRHAIDAVRWAAGFDTPKWSNYNPVTGPILAAYLYDPGSGHNDLRSALDDAVMVIRGTTIGYTPPAPASGAKIWAYQVQEIRQGVK